MHLQTSDVDPPYLRTGLLLTLGGERREGFILVGGDQVDARIQRRLPPRLSRGAGAEVVGVPPALIFTRREAVERVEADPVAELVGVIDQGLEARGVARRPVAG